MAYRFYRTAANVLWLAAGWILKLRAASSASWSERLGELPVMEPGSIWVHAASVGEVSAALPLIRSLHAAGQAVLLTVLTPTGRAVARREIPEGVEIAHPPLDFVRPVRTALARVSPRALLLVETELWPTLILEARRAGAIVGIVNGRLSERSTRRYRAIGSPLPGVISAVSFVACQSERERLRFVAVGFPQESVHAVGNMKFDTVDGPLPGDRREATRRALGIPADVPVVVYGSVRPAEEESVARAAASIERQFPEAWQVAAPRHLDRAEPLARRLAAAGVSPARRSVEGREPPASRTILLDTTGELSSAYAIASVAFVGGSLGPYGGHNPLEPAAQGVPVVLGPHTESCPDSAAALVEGGAAVVVRSGSELREVIRDLLRMDGHRVRAGESALRVVRGGRGATDRTVSLLAREGILGETGA